MTLNHWGEDDMFDLQRMPGQKQATPMQPQPRPDNFAYIVLVESTYHTEESPFCFADDHCPCHEDQEAIQRVQQWLQAGLMTETEATNFILGRTF